MTQLVRSSAGTLARSCLTVSTPPDWLLDLQMFAINMFVIMVLVMIAGQWAELTPNSDYDFTISSTQASNMVDAITTSEKMVEKPGGAGANEVLERSNLGDRNKFFQVFTADGPNVFTAANIQSICKAEALLIEADEFAAGRPDYAGEVGDKREDGYPGMCLLKNPTAIPLGSFKDDCTTGPLPLVSDLFYPKDQTAMAGNMQSCTHADAGTTQEIRWDKHIDMDAQQASRGLSYTCPAGGVSRCTLLDEGRVEYFAHDLLCAAAADPTSPMSFYLSPPDGETALSTPQGCEPDAYLLKTVGAHMTEEGDLKTALTEGCYAAVEFISESTDPGLIGLSCNGGDAAAVLNNLAGVAGGTIPAGKTLQDLCPFRCDRFTETNSIAAPPDVKKTRELIYMAWPLQGYKDRPLQGDEQQKKISTWYYDLEGSLFTYYGLDQTGSAMTSAMRAEAKMGDVEVMWWGFALQDLEFTRISYQDLSFTMASILFVYYYICFYTGTLFIGALGMLQIILTLPLALFFYRGVFQVTFFNQLHVLAIYLVLGIGADDIFVFMDGWNQSINQYRNTADRLDATFKRAVYAMGATSSTTCVAFMATAVSPIMPIASFGIYAALGVFFNYVLAITLFPCVLMIWHYKLYGCCARLPGGLEKCISLVSIPACHKRDEAVCCCQQPYSLPAVVTAQTNNFTEGKDQKAEDEEILRGLDRFFKEKYAPCITKKPVAGCMSITGLIYIIFCIVMALQLEPPTEQEKWFPADHMYQKIVESMATFASAAEDQYIPVTIAFGLKGMDRSDKNFWDAVDRGYTEFDDSFDLSSAAAQRFFLDTCDALIAEKCTLEGCLGDTLVMPLTSEDICGAPDGHMCIGEANACSSASISQDVCESAGACKWNPADSTCTRRDVWKDGGCWMQQFKEYCASESSCTGSGSSFVADVTTFRNSRPAISGMIGLIGDGGSKLKYAQISVRSTLQEFQPNAITEPVFWAFDELCKRLEATATEAGVTIGTIVHSGGVFWTWTFTEAQLVTNVFVGFAICFPCAYVVLLVATRNLWLATIAIVAVMGIVASVLGFCHWAMGWGLGIAESIAAVIVIGFSVDYVVHLSHVYVEAGHRDPPLNDREERVTFALKSMGGTVFSGAITTFGSGLFLVFTQLIFFVKFSVLIMVTIASSIGASTQHVDRLVSDSSTLLKRILSMALLCTGIALLFYMPTLAFIGPQGTFGDMQAGCKKRKYGVGDASLP